MRRHVLILLASFLCSAPVCADESDLLNLDWGKRQELTIPQLFEAIRLTPSGRDVAKDLLPLYEQGKLRILLSSSGNLPGEWSAKENLNGAYSNGLLFVDDSIPMLSVVGTFFHELTHAHDALLTAEGRKRADLVVQYWSSAKSLFARIKMGEEISEAEQRAFLDLKPRVELILLEDERRAYRAQDQFMKELLELNGEFSPMLKKLTEEKYWIGYPVTDPMFRALMVNRKGLALPAPLVDDFLRNN